MVDGKVAPVETSLAVGGLPIGLARDVALRSDVPAGTVLQWDDVVVDPTNPAVKLRRELESHQRCLQTA